MALGYGATRLRVNPTLDRLRSVTEGRSFLEEVTDAFALPSDVTRDPAAGRSISIGLLDDNAALVETARRRVPSVPLAGAGAVAAVGVSSSARALIRTGIAIGREHRVTTSNAAAAAAGFCPARSIPSSTACRMLAAANPLTYEGFAAHRLEDVISRFVVTDEDQWMLATYAFPKTDEEAALARRSSIAARGWR